MLSVPLDWHDHGRRRAQRPDPRAAATSTRTRSRFLRTIAALLAGIVEKGRLTAEVEARLAQLTALDAARAELLSVVTHELRTPLSVVRVYVDLLAEVATGGVADCPSRRRAEDWRDGRDGPAGAARPPGRFDPGLGPRRGPDRAVAGAVRRRRRGRRDGRDAAAPAPAAPDPLGAAGRRRMTAIGDETRFRQVLEQLLENESKYAPSAEGVSIGDLAGRRRDPGLRHRRRAGRPDRGLGERLRAVRPDRGPRPVARLRDRAVRRAPADERDGRPDLPRAQRLREQPVRGGPARGLGSPPEHRRPQRAEVQLRGRAAVGRIRPFRSSRTRRRTRGTPPARPRPRAARPGRSARPGRPARGWSAGSSSK